MYARMEEIQDEEPGSGFLLYRFSNDNRTTSNALDQQTDFIDILAAANDLNIPLLPIVWQTARSSLGLGGTSLLRQTPLDVRTELAFKLVKDEEKVLGKPEEILSLILNEIRILSIPQVQSNPNIVDLLGICWDISANNVVWPGLVFQKSHYGDLWRFASLPVWADLNVEDKLRICIDVGNALSDMHHHRIIHADLKPQNILIFRENDKFIAKVTDFGYSRLYSTPADRRTLSLSEPWEAPEVDGSDKTFDLLQAKQADIYSYALLCIWVLYEYRFREILTSTENKVPPDSIEKKQMTSVSMLRELKRTDQLLKTIMDFVIHDEELTSEYRTALQGFLQSALVSNLSIRSHNLSQSFSILEQ